jgi:hypothetical protein
VSQDSLTSRRLAAFCVVHSRHCEWFELRFSVGRYPDGRAVLRVVACEGYRLEAEPGWRSVLRVRRPGRLPRLRCAPVLLGRKDGGRR